jgi:hypothetical protein
LSYNFSLKDIIGILQRVAAISSSDDSPLYLVQDVNNDGRMGIEEAIYILQSVAGTRDQK